MDFGFSRSMGGGVLDRYDGRVLSQYKRNPPVICRRVVSLKFASSNVYSFIRLPTFAINSLTGSNSGCISSAVVT